MAKRRRAKATIGRTYDNPYVRGRMEEAERTISQVEHVLRDAGLRRPMRTYLDDALARLRDQIGAAVDRAYTDGNEDGYQEGREAAEKERTK